jgi:hypothetical protein
LPVQESTSRGVQVEELLKERRKTAKKELQREKLQQGGRYYIDKRKELQFSRHRRVGAERARLAHSFKSEWQRRMISTFDSSVMLKTLEFLHFQIFQSKQVIIVERALWLGIWGPGRTADHRDSMEANWKDVMWRRNQKFCARGQ